MKEMPQSRFSSFQCALWLGLLCVVLQLRVYAEPWQDSALAGSLRLDEEGRNLALPEPLRAEKLTSPDIETFPSFRSLDC